MNRLRAILSLVLAITILVASVGITVNAHLCGGRIQSTALFVKPAPCGMMKLMAHMTHRAKARNKCCDEQAKVYKTTEENAEKVVALAIVHIDTPVERILPFLCALLPSPVLVEIAHCAPDDHPPFISRDITVATHTFLI